MSTNKNTRLNDLDEKSGGAMLSEILVLLLKLLLKCIINLFKLILKGLELLLELFKMFLQVCINFWNDNSTQEKVRLIKIWLADFSKAVLRLLVAGIKAFGHYTIVGLIGLWHGLIWLSKATVNGIIHLKPTLFLIGRYISKGWTFTCKWIRFVFRIIKLIFVKRKKAYLTFRRNKGFKGLLLDIKTFLQAQVKDYMDEGQEEQTSTASGYGDFLTEDSSEDTKAKAAGKKFIKKINSLTDND